MRSSDTTRLTKADKLKRELEAKLPHGSFSVWKWHDNNGVSLVVRVDEPQYQAAKDNLPPEYLGLPVIVEKRGMG